MCKLVLVALQGIGQHNNLSRVGDSTHDGETLGDDDNFCKFDYADDLGTLGYDDNDHTRQLDDHDHLGEYCERKRDRWEPGTAI
jgi:deferrochelatase/peroxidase EfeB